MTQSIIKEQKAQIHALRERTALAENHRGPWSKEDKAMLVKMFKEDVGITNMALHFQRSELAVANQVAKLYPRVRKPSQGSESCKCPQCIHYKNCLQPCPERTESTDNLDS